MYDATTLKFIDYYDSVHAAAKCNGIKIDLVQRSIKCGYSTHGYYFSNNKEPYYSRVEAKKVGNNPIYLYDIDGKYITTLDNKKAILEFFNIKTMSQIRDCIRSKKVYRGYQLSLTKEKSLQPAKDEFLHPKKVGMYDDADNLIKIFDTVTSARNEIGRGVLKCLKGQQSKCGGYHFRYIS